MGSLPPPSLDFSSINHNSLKNGGSSHQHHQEISRDNLLNLFTSQQDLLNHFFKHLDLSQTLDLLYSSLFITRMILRSKKHGFICMMNTQSNTKLIVSHHLFDLNGDGKKEVLVATNDAKIQEDFPHNAHHREIAISISNYTLKHGDTSLVIVGGQMEMQPMHIQWIHGDEDGDETVFRTFSCLSVVGFVNFGNSLCLGCIYIIF